MEAFDLSLKVNTSAEHHITAAENEEPSFDEKNQLFWNGTLRNTHIKKADGFATTTGQTVVVKKYKGNKDGKDEQGVSLVSEKTQIDLPFKSVLKDFYKCKPKAAGKQIAHTLYNNRIFTLYKSSQQVYTVIETDLDDNLIKSTVLDCNSAMISSVYQLDEQPILFINKKVRHSATDFENHVAVYDFIDFIDFDRNQPKYEYILDENLHQTLLTLQQQIEDQTEIVSNLLSSYQSLLKLDIDENIKNQINETYSKYLLEYNKLQDLEKTYLNILFDYDKREEVKWCEEKIKEKNYVVKDLQTELDTLNEENADTSIKQETLVANIAKLEEHIAADKERVYSMKAPSLSEDAQKIKQQLDNTLTIVKKEFDSVDKKYIQQVKLYRDSLDKYTEKISWSWAISSTKSRSGGYEFNGHRANLLLPSSNYSVGDIVANSNRIMLNANLVGTLSGYGALGSPTIQFSANTSETKKIAYAAYGADIYLDVINSKQLGINWKMFANYKNVLDWNAKYKTALNQYNIAKAEYSKQMQQNPELNAYLRFVQSYEQFQAHINTEQAQIDELKRSLNELNIKSEIYLKQKKYLEETIVKLNKQLDELRQQLKRAEIAVSKMKKQQVLDENGNVVYNEIEPIFKYDSEDGIPLGDAHSGTIFRDSDGIKHCVIGFDDDDKNRALTIHYNGSSQQRYKWFGCIAVDGTVTGEPIPDPDVFTQMTRASNGTYRINMKDTFGKYIEGTLIGGYEWKSNKYSKIEIESWTNTESVRVNMSTNDTLTEEEKKDKKADPKQYFVSNFIESRGLYYDYGPGWIKCYVRKISLNSNVIKDCYIYTFGSVNETNLRYRKESVMAKGKTKEWPFAQDKLNKRIYTVGATNKAEDSILSILPFSVQIIPDETSTETGTLPGLRMQMFGLLPLSFSYRQSLVANGEEHTDQFQIQYSADKNTIILSTLSMIYIIKNTSQIEDFKIYKVADYYFQTNILDNKNILIEDRSGNLSVERGCIPYCEECVLDIADKSLTIPDASKDLVANNTWYWAAAYNTFFLETANSSYLLPAISLPLFVDNEQLEKFQEETLEQRGSLLKPMLKGLFDEYEGIDVFYTVATVTTTLYYKTTHIVKVSDINDDKYDIYGKETFDVDLQDTIYSVSTASQFFPIASGSVVKGINYITPTVELENEYAARLYNSANKLYGGYQYASRIYNGTNIFTIYGRNYYYDHQGIYFIGTSDSYTSNQFVCYALGLQFLASSGSEAYFYSPFDKQVYIFTGSNTLQRMQYLSNQEDIVDSIFSSQEQVLYLLMSNNKLIMLSEKDTAILDVPDINVQKAHLEGNELGCCIVEPMKRFICFSPYRELDDTLPFKLQTGFIGSNASLIKLSFFDFVLFKLTDKPITIDLTINTLNGIERKSETKQIKITPDMWKGSSYRIRYSPQNNVGNSFQVGISSDDYIAVAYHGWEAAPYGNGAAPTVVSIG